ncbi:hypothetical protein [Halovivax limisalsi]|uniref:hypothetical protein n=1 Tax=Halovivax limisalsi TaxID=1453760 RepID=UPI001FFD6770|nr:hypothetical protein [Halovivax limisalsi]
MARRSRPRLLDVAGAISVGIVAFATVAVAVTAALDPHIWPSALVGLPAGLLAGVIATIAAHRRLTR